MSTAIRRLAAPAVVGTALAVVLGSGIAAAYYGSPLATSGSGSATVAGESTVTMTVTGTFSTGLYPGGPGADVTIAVTNPYGRSLSITSVTATGNVAVTPLAGRTCATTGLTVATPASLPVTVAANASAAPVTFPGLVKMGLTAENGCQGASFSMTFVIMGQV